MLAFNPLRLILLATLQSRPRKKLSRYAVMIDINHIFSAIDSPYSPGAVYHEASKLKQEQMITINQSELEITASGIRWLQDQLSITPLPSSILGKAYYLIAADLVGNADIRKIALQRVEIDMIKNRQIEPKNEPVRSSSNPALNICLSNLSDALKKTVIDISAY
jgi:hypothetical protein